MFRKHHRKSSNPLFVLFRLILSLVMFVILLGGAYSAYKHFSGVDPLKLDPTQVLSEALKGKVPSSLLSVLSSVKVGPKILGQSKQAVIPLDNLTQKQPQNSASALFKFLLIADSENDNQNLKKAITQAKASNDLKFIIGLGDYTDVGTVSELTAAKNVLDSAGLRYFLVAGNHDLWDSRNRQVEADTDFKSVFGVLYQSFEFNNFKFLLLDNSDDYKGFGDSQTKWITSELEKAKTEGVKGIFVFLHEPLYHPSSDHFMGSVEKDLKPQVDGMIYQLKQASVKKVFAGDIHFFSEYEEPVTKIPMMTVGALVTDRNPQAPRYGVVTVFDDGTTHIDDIEVK